MAPAAAAAATAAATALAAAAAAAASATPKAAAALLRAVLLRHTFAQELVFKGGLGHVRVAVATAIAVPAAIPASLPATAAGTAPAPATAIGDVIAGWVAFTIRTVVLRKGVASVHGLAPGASHPPARLAVTTAAIAERARRVPPLEEFPAALLRTLLRHHGRAPPPAPSPA
eukprot:357326-Chlamydomonas_euryale.AAC.1